jgi:hypothetical protein
MRRFYICGDAARIESTLEIDHEFPGFKTPEADRSINGYGKSFEVA